MATILLPDGAFTLDSQLLHTTVSMSLLHRTGVGTSWALLTRCPGQHLAHKSSENWNEKSILPVSLTVYDVYGLFGSPVQPASDTHRP